MAVEMTKKEAKRVLSFHLMQCGMLMPIEWVRKNGEGSEVSEAFRMAMDALHEQEGRSKGCDFCRADKEGYYSMAGAFSITNPFHAGKYYLNCGRVKPRRIVFCPMCGRKLEGDVG